MWVRPFRKQSRYHPTPQRTQTSATSVIFCVGWCVCPRIYLYAGEHGQYVITRTGRACTPSSWAHQSKSKHTPKLNNTRFPVAKCIVYAFCVCVSTCGICARAYIIDNPHTPRNIRPVLPVLWQLFFSEQKMSLLLLKACTHTKTYIFWFELTHTCETLTSWHIPAPHIVVYAPKCDYCAIAHVRAVHWVQNPVANCGFHSIYADRI